MPDRRAARPGARPDGRDVRMRGPPGAARLRPPRPRDAGRGGPGSSHLAPGRGYPIRTVRRRRELSAHATSPAEVPNSAGNPCALAAVAAALRCQMATPGASGLGCQREASAQHPFPTAPVHDGKARLGRPGAQPRAAPALLSRTTERAASARWFPREPKKPSGEEDSAQHDVPPREALCWPHGAECRRALGEGRVGRSSGAIALGTARPIARAIAAACAVLRAPSRAGRAAILALKPAPRATPKGPRAPRLQARVLAWVFPRPFMRAGAVLPRPCPPRFGLMQEASQDLLPLPTPLSQRRREGGREWQQVRWFGNRSDGAGKGEDGRTRRVQRYG